MKLGEWHLNGTPIDVPDIYISGDDDNDTRDIRVSFVGSNVQFWCDMPPEHLELLHELIGEVLGNEDVRSKMPERATKANRCAACGYTIAAESVLCGECACEDDGI